MKTYAEGLNQPLPKNKLKVSSPFDVPQTKDVYDPEQPQTPKVPAGYYSLKELLVSRFVFYDFSDLHIRPFNTSEIILLNYAHTSQSLRPVAQAINNVFYEDYNCLAMTYTDIKQIMAWLRLNSYHKSEFTYDAVCSDKEHTKKIVSGELDVETLITPTVTKSSDFIEEPINYEASQEIFQKIKDEYSLELIPETFGMHIEVEELLASVAPIGEDGKYLLSEISAKDNNKLFIANYAKYLSPMYGESLEEKIEFFSSLKLPPDLYVDIQNFVHVTSHGLKETLTTNCRGCGAQIVTNVAFEPRSFFP